MPQRHEATARGRGLRARHLSLGEELRGAPKGVEIRCGVELRASAAPEAAPNTIEGYASVYNQEADIGPWCEIVAPGAFDKVLAAGPDVRFLFDHDGIPLARTTSGTLELWSDAHGLGFRCSLGESPYAQSVYEAIVRGDLSQCSIAFIVGAELWNIAPDGCEKRTIVEVAELLDASTVTYPAFDVTNVAATRSAPSGIEGARAVAADAAPDLGDSDPDADPDVAEARAGADGFKAHALLTYQEMQSKL